MVICLERGADCLHMVQLMPPHLEIPPSFASFESRLVFFCGTGLNGSTVVIYVICNSVLSWFSKYILYFNYNLM